MSDIAKLDYSKPPPQYVVEPAVLGGRWCWDSLDPRDGVETMGYASGPGQDAALAAAWTHYKIHNDPPGMIVVWESDDKHFAPDGDGEWHVCLGDQVQATIGATVCWWNGRRWELTIDGRGPYSGWLKRSRAWAWAWHDRRHTLTRDLLKDEQLLQTLGATIEFVQILCWHDEWVEEAEAWTMDKSRPIPEAFFTLMKREEVRRG